MTKILHTILFLLLCILLCGCSTTAAKANRALEEGNYNDFCKISADSLEDGGQSYHNVGLCYENAWGGYPKDIEMAIESYLIAARWNVPESKERLESLEVEVPYPDLERQRQEEERDNQIQMVNVAASVASIALLAAAVYLDHEYNKDYDYDESVPELEVPSTCQLRKS